jgi:hypothetical protein
MGMNVVSLTHNRFTLLLLTIVHSVLCLVVYGTVGSILEVCYRYPTIAAVPVYNYPEPDSNTGIVCLNKD